MALGFFRRWQKGILIGIVVVMLLGFVFGGVLQYIARRSARRDFDRGNSKFGAVTHNAVTQAENDLRNLAAFLGLGQWSNEFNQLSGGNGENSSMAYALLLQEAQASGYEVGQAEIDSYLKQIGLEVGQAGYRKVISRVDKRKSGTTEPRLRNALGRWLMVLRSFRAYQVTSPPSEAELKKLFRDLNEKLTLRIVKVPADKYVADVPEPVESQITQQFNKYRSARPGVFPTGESLGFGYAQPIRAAVSYMTINSDAIARVSRPDDSAVRAYFRDNASDFKKDVPVVPQPEPLPGATTKPDVVTKKVQMNMDEAWSQVVDRLLGWAAETKTEEFVQFVEARVDSRLEQVSADAKLFQHIYDNIVDSDQAAATLVTMVKAKDIAALRGRTLDQAMPALAKAAGLTAICYPWDAQGDFSVSKDVRIPDSLNADAPRTLGAVLEEITRLVFTIGKEKLEAVPSGGSATTKPKAPQYPILKWTSFHGLAKILFPVGTDKGMTLLPISVGRTELMDGRQLSQHKDLGTAQNSRRGRGTPLATAAIKAKPLSPGRLMFAYGAGGLNRILWQVIASKPAEVLAQPTDAVRKDVIADCKTLASYKDAAARVADKLAARARVIGLQAAAKEAKFEVTASEPVSRLVSQSQRDMMRQMVMRQAIMGGIPEGVTPQEFWAQLQSYTDRMAINYHPHDYMSSRVPGVEAQSPQAAKRFMDRVFTLVPDDIEKPIAAGDIGPVANIPMPTDRAHYIVQRVGYTPAVVADFESTSRAVLASEAMANAKWEARRGFFAFSNIASRVAYVDGATKKKSDDDAAKKESDGK